MILGTKTSIHTTSKADFAQIALASFALLSGLVASASVFFNDTYFWWQSHHYINPYLFLIAFFLALPRKAWGLMGCIFLLPLSAGLGNQLNAYLSTNLLALPNAGLDLVAGFFLGSLISLLQRAGLNFKNKAQLIDNLEWVRRLVPWPVALVIAMITISTAIAISRNVYQSAAATSLKGLLFNLVHFRPIGWHDDYMPIADWIAYALAVAMIAVVIAYLKEQSNKNQIIFRPLIAGLIVAAVMGIVQAITGIGLPESLLVFRKDLLGYAAIGFQPDLHAYAGHMLLGTVGLWGYFSITRSKLERQFILCAVTLSWVGLVLSKSRALFLLAFIAMFIWLLFYLWKTKRHLLIPYALASIALFGALLTVLLNYAHSLNDIPVLSWLGELATGLKGTDLTSWSLVSGLFGSRFEIWEGALRMWWEFPLMGVGQGNFYRLSDIASFSKSHYLILMGGENAHNYFLQTLTETGLIGIAVFSLALIMPLIGSNNKKALLPAIVGLVSLFLGNFFAHSFLVRENLLIAAVFIGLLYSQNIFYDKFTHHLKKDVLTRNQQRVLYGILTILLATVLIEIYSSYGKPPFTYGFLCNMQRPLTNDKWTKGLYQLPIPLESKGVRLNLNVQQFNKHNEILNLKLELRHLKKNAYGYNDAVDSVVRSYSISQNSDLDIDISFSDRKYTNQFDAVELEIRTSKCFTPRNWGDSTDARILGVQIKSVQTY